jgi:hypothetical protein
MATITNIDSESTNPLSISLHLLDLETNIENDLEGWLEYELELKSGSKIVASTHSTIHDSDVRAIENICIKSPASHEEYEPMEPDFYIEVVKLNIEDTVFRCFIDSAISSEQEDSYSGSHIGISISCIPLDIINFGAKLRQERILITKDKAWEL